MKIKLFLFISLLIPGLIGLTSARAATYYVEVSGADSPARNGLSAATAWRSLDSARDQVAAGNHVIALGSGTFAARTSYPKAGVTIRGRGITQTTLRAAATWTLTGMLHHQDCSNYLIAIDGLNLSYINITETGGGCVLTTAAPAQLPSRFTTIYSLKPDQPRPAAARRDSRLVLSGGPHGYGPVFQNPAAGGVIYYAFFALN